MKQDKQKYDSKLHIDRDIFGGSCVAGEPANDSLPSLLLHAGLAVCLLATSLACWSLVAHLAALFLLPSCLLLISLCLLLDFSCSSHM